MCQPLAGRAGARGRGGALSLGANATALLSLMLSLLWPVCSASSSPARAPSLYLGPCNASDPNMQWRGEALTSPGGVGPVENVGAMQCLSTLGKDPATLGPCGSGAATLAPDETIIVLRPPLHSY